MVVLTKNVFHWWHGPWKVGSCKAENLRCFVFFSLAVCACCVSTVSRRSYKRCMRNLSSVKTVKTSPQLNMKFKACIKFHLKGAPIGGVFARYFFVIRKSSTEKNHFQGAQVRLLHPSCHQFECPSLVVEVPLTTVGFSILSVPLDIHPPNTETEDWGSVWLDPNKTYPTNHQTSVSVWLDVVFSGVASFSGLWSRRPGFWKNPMEKPGDPSFCVPEIHPKILQKVEILNIWKIQV